MIYRREAVDHLRLGNDSNCTVLRATPRWVKWPFLVLLALFVVLAITALTSTRNEYIVGVSVVRADNLRVVVAPSDFVVAALSVTPGDTVQDGQVLISSANGGNILQSPNSPTSGDLRTSNALLEAITSPISGIVVGIRVRNGEEVSQGEVLCTIAPANCTYSLTMFLPGNSRPFLMPGTRAWFSARGFEDTRVEFALNAVNNEAVDERQLQRLWQPAPSENLPSKKPFVVAWGRLPTPLVSRDGLPIHYFDGMVGTVRVLAGTTPLIHFFSRES